MHASVLVVVLLLSVAPGVVPQQQEDLLKRLNDTMQILVRQLMLEQFYNEERIRSSGNSGIKQVRHQRDGTRPYHTETHIGSGVASIHDHGDSIMTMGMGEFHVVLNGVEFRTRHNDYLLKMPAYSREYHELKDVPFPRVPPSVREQPTIAGQILEMREYFKAFKNQDISHRDYRPYFKPVLSYLEGAWTFTGEEMEEPFPGERHWIAAKTWRELEDKVAFTGYAGTKENLENLAHLPRTIVGIKNGTIPIIAQWNYRILCHPLKRDLPTNRLHIVDDIATRMVTGTSLKEMAETREARFKLNPTDSQKWTDGRYIGTLLDELMSEIPGKDNYPGVMNDFAFGNTARDPTTDARLNTAYYHHLFKYSGKDGMGMQIRHRGFSDETLFMAQTTQAKVAGKDFNNCMHDWVNFTNCAEFHQKWSYAFPMEILYLTPLANWNPYNIKYHGWAATEKGQQVLAGQRNGSYYFPYDGTNSKFFFRTPAEFYETEEEDSTTKADTTGSHVHVLDYRGTPRKVRASGHRIFIPDIPGVGKIRQRYPIMPVHAEGTSVWKELEALKDVVLNPGRNKHMFYSSPSEKVESYYSKVEMKPASSRYDSHTHELELTEADHKLILEGGVVTKTSTQNNGHQHTVDLVVERTIGGVYRLIMVNCDRKSHCWDGHSRLLAEGFTRDGQFSPDIESPPTEMKEEKNIASKEAGQTSGAAQSRGHLCITAPALLVIMLL